MTLRAATVLLCSLACAGGPVRAFAADRHVGVGSCANGVCHGASNLSGGRVRQDEYLTWQRQDHHSRAYATLRSERSRRIAANLGIAEATVAPECLACHADAVPEAERGARFQLSDGVGCEVCHGGAERWLTGHARGYASSKERLAAGLTATWDPPVRAELCLSCHQGSAQRQMTHAIMGAGHPPLLFELDTFGLLQPVHYASDADYAKRKGKPDGARNWAVGQAVAARGLLVGLGGPGLGEGLFPELVWFDCNACHHSLQSPRWEREPGVALSPGHVPIADAPLYFTAQWLDIVKPELGTRWRAEVTALRQAAQRSAGGLRERAQAAQKLLEAEVLPLAIAHEHTRPELSRIAQQLLDGATGARAGDFSVAEQTAMATAVMVTALESGATAPKGVRDAIDGIYGAVANRDRYEPDRMRGALKKAREQIAKAYPGTGSPSSR